LVQIIFSHNPHTCLSIFSTDTSRHLSQHRRNRYQAPEARTWRLTKLHRRLPIAFYPGASSKVQRDENHSVPGQGCREDGPVPPNFSAVTTHAWGWLCVAWRVSVTLAPYTSTSWRWISAGDVPFSRRNLITLLTSMFDHISASPAILQLMLGQYDLYEALSSVRERKECSTCSDLARSLNEIRNITQVRGLVTLFIESPSYINVQMHIFAIGVSIFRNILGNLLYCCTVPNKVCAI
jgi:hypothetical protein